jgi:hypothetical protein
MKMTTPNELPRKLLGVACRLRVRESLHRDDELIDEGAHALKAALDEVQNLRAAMQWYADGLHFDKANPDAWDTVSGEPPNWWCDEAGTATVEDGSIAAMVLRGELTGEQVQALE